MAPRAPVATRELQDRLARHERMLSQERLHVIVLARQVAAFLGATFLAFYIEANAPSTSAGRNAANLGWMLFFAASGWLAWGALNWRRDWFVVTDKRLLKLYGVVNRRIATMPMRKVTDITYERSPLGRLLGYGTFILESAGQEQALRRIDHVRDSNAHYDRICSVLFGGPAQVPSTDDDGWDDGGWDGGGGAGGGLPSPPAPPYAGQHVRPSPGAPSEPVGTHAWTGRGHGGDDPFDWDSDTSPGAAPPSETLYRSEDLVDSEREADTGEIPVIRARPMPPHGFW
jgi:membrane protein YdbS with pleckstrin-like domain